MFILQRRKKTNQRRVEVTVKHAGVVKAVMIGEGTGTCWPVVYGSVSMEYDR